MEAPTIWLREIRPGDRDFIGTETNYISGRRFGKRFDGRFLKRLIRSHRVPIVITKNPVTQRHYGGTERLGEMFQIGKTVLEILHTTTPISPARFVILRGRPVALDAICP